MDVRPIRLYDFPFSGNGYKVRLALHHLGLPVERQIIDILKGENRTPSFLARNPMGEIPALELSDGTVLRESNAILFWLGEGTPLLPAGRLDRTRVVQWMCFEQSNIDRVLGRARFLKAHPEFATVAQFDMDTWRAAGHRALAVLDAELRHREYLVADVFSVADICLYGYVHTAREGGFELDSVPAVNAWLSRVAAQPRHILQ
jgi:glutathione S-transferase